MRTKLDVQHVDLKERRVYNELREVVEDRQEKQKEYANSRRAVKDVNFGIGDMVRVRKPVVKKGERMYTEPKQIVQKLGRATYQLADGNVWHRNRLVSARIVNEYEIPEIRERDFLIFDTLTSGVPGPTKPKVEGLSEGNAVIDQSSGIKEVETEAGRGTLAESSSDDKIEKWIKILEERLEKKRL